MAATISRVFNNCSSQAVRIPQEFRLSSERVEISRTAEGDLLIRALPELLKGAVGSQRKALVLKQLDALICEIPVLFDASTAMCKHCAEHSMRLKAAGTPIGGNDLWIACHALAEGATIVTNNTREFAHVAGLALENWA